MPKRKTNAAHAAPTAQNAPPGAHIQDAKLVADALDATNLSVILFARFITREAQTVHRWAAGLYALPRVVRLRLLEILATNPEERYFEVQSFLARVARMQRRERGGRAKKPVEV